MRNNKLDPDEVIDLRGLDRYTAIWKLDVALADVYAKWNNDSQTKEWMYTIRTSRFDPEENKRPILLNVVRDYLDSWKMSYKLNKERGMFDVSL